MDGYYSHDELINLGFGKIGENSKISKKCTFFNISHIFIGNNSRIDDNCILSASKKGIEIGNFVHISNNVVISGDALIKIEDFCGLSSKVTIFGSTDDYSGEYMSNPCVSQYNKECTNVKSENIIIGKHAIIGCNSVILPGCSIVAGASVGSLSLVNRKIIEVGIYHGNPIQFISKKSNNYLKIENKYFKKEDKLTNNTNNITNNITNDTNNVTNNTNNILNILRKYISFNEKINLDKCLSYNGIDSLSFIQIQNEINKYINKKINHDMTINDIIKLDSNINNELYEKIDYINSFENKNDNSFENKNDNLKKNNVTIIGTGHSSGSKKIDNDFYTNFLETDDEWIKKRTGIESKFILDENETLEELIINSSIEAIKNSNIQPTSIDLLIICSSTPEDLFGDASKIAYKLGATNAFGFDIRNACNGFLTGILTAEKYLKSDNKYKIALVIGADCLSRYVNWNDRKSCILFGDGAGAVVLKKSEGINDGILASLFKTSGDLNTILNIDSKDKKVNINGIELLSRSYNSLSIDGITVFNYVVDNLANYISNFLIENNININEIKYFVLHQANIRIIDEVCSKLNVNKDKFITNINIYGNTSAASIPILLNETYKNNKLKKNDLILFSGFGAGMSVGIMLMRWSLEQYSSNTKVALVTGGSKGIGKNIAIKLRNKGYKTIICSRNSDNNLYNIEHHVCDVSKPNEVSNLYNNIMDKYGRLDILINNAGIEGSENLFINTEINDIEKIVNINLMGTLYTTKFFSETLIKNKGFIINISSIACANNINNCFRRTLYSATKSAIGTFTRGLSGEMKNKCKVFSINPPFVNTDLLDRIIKSSGICIDKTLINNHGFIKNQTELIEPDDISNFISLLIDEKTSYKSGDEILLIDHNKSCNMKYLYEKIHIRDNSQIEINDLEIHPIVNLCFFQGQGTKLTIQIDEINNYIKINKLDELIKKITNFYFNEIFEKFNNNFINTFYQQLIFFIISYVKFQIEKENDIEFFKNVKYMVGYSLGELTALVCSEKISFEDGIRIVFVRGYNMHLISENIDTSMIVVKGIEINQLKSILNDKLYISINFSDKMNIIGGDKKDLNLFKDKILNMDKNIIINDLLVEGSYHTPFYKEVEKELDSVLYEVDFKDNDIHIISNYDNCEYNQLNFKELIKNQITNTVQWNNTLNILRKKDIHKFKEINLSTKYLINEFIK